MSAYRPAPGETEVVPACDLCGGGQVLYGLCVWDLDDPKWDEHESHDAAPRWVTDMRLPFPHGVWLNRDTMAERAFYKMAVASARRANRREEER